MHTRAHPEHPRRPLNRIENGLGSVDGAEHPQNRPRARIDSRVQGLPEPRHSPAPGRDRVGDHALR